MVYDMGVDKVADMEVDMVADMEVATKVSQAFVSPNFFKLKLTSPTPVAHHLSFANFFYLGTSLSRGV